jgi:hypothetical protein
LQTRAAEQVTSDRPGRQGVTGAAGRHDTRAGVSTQGGVLRPDGILHRMDPKTPPGDVAPETTTRIQESGTAAPDGGLAGIAPAGSGDAAPPVADQPSWAQPESKSRRRSLVPRWVPLAVVVAVAVVASTAGFAVWNSRSSLVAVPSVRGLDSAAAKSAVESAGMRVYVGERRFSPSVAAGLVLEQRPAAGTRVSPGTRVVLSVSAGSERFPMPDVIGMQIDAVQRLLAPRGVAIFSESASSEQSAGTVIMSFPSAGVVLTTGETVRLTVAGSATATGVLLPTDLRNLRFVIDTAPVAAGSASDPPSEVARRLRALLEASGAAVVMTRDVADPASGPSVALRVERSRTASATALVGFETLAAGAGGLSLRTVPEQPETIGFFLTSSLFARAVKDALTATFPKVGTAPGQGDTVLVEGGVSAVRVVLGSQKADADVRSWGDPRWADSVAQAVYRGIAAAYAPK